MNHRILYLDVLRIFSIFAVITIHVSCHFFTEQLSFDWYVSCAYDSICRWCVPVFCMISGALFLDNNKVVPIKDLYRKYIWRIILAFCFWSVPYAILSPLISGGNLNLRTFLGDFFQGHYHLWYLFLIVGLYILLPILKYIFNSVKILWYYLLLCVFFSFVIPFVFDVAHSFRLFENFVMKVESGYNHMYLTFLSCYVFYFLIGGYISTNIMHKSRRIFIYIIGILSFLLVFSLTCFIMYQQTDGLKINQTFFNYQSVLVMLMAVSIFVFCKHLRVIGNVPVAPLKFVSKNVFGIYLIHVLILDLLIKFFNINSDGNAFLYIPILSIVVFVLSLGCVMILRAILPYSKYFI